MVVRAAGHLRWIPGTARRRQALPFGLGAEEACWPPLLEFVRQLYLLLGRSLPAWMHRPLVAPCLDQVDELTSLAAIRAPGS